jgi:hypothetical protein
VGGHRWGGVVRNAPAGRIARARSAATLLTLAAAVVGTLVSSGGAQAGAAITPGLAAGGVPLSATVGKVVALLGLPSDELQDPTNPRIYIQRWEDLCLGARYTPEGDLLALDVWVDAADRCPASKSTYGVEAAGGHTIDFGSTRSDVKRAFGYRPDRVLHGGRFSVLVYEGAGVAFYIREAGERNGLVDSITVFPRHSSPSVWAPPSWGGQ